jgi:hypothetical protein
MAVAPPLAHQGMKKEVVFDGCLRQHEKGRLDSQESGCPRSENFVCGWFMANVTRMEDG